MTHTKHTTALQLIQQGWTKGAAARDALGFKVGYDSDAAVCWCSMGAICAVYGYGSEHNCALDRLQKVVRSNIVFWNDKPGRTKEDVIEAFVKAGI